MDISEKLVMILDSQIDQIYKNEQHRVDQVGQQAFYICVSWDKLLKVIKIKLIFREWQYEIIKI